MLQEALILALFTFRYIQHWYSSLEIQNAFKKPTIKPWFSTLQHCQSFQIASEWLPSNTVLRVNIQRLKLSRNPSSCGVCCIAFRRTSSPGEEPAPLTRRGDAQGPELLHLSLHLGRFGNQVTTVPTSATQGGPSLPSACPAGRTSTQNPARTAPGVPSRSPTLPAKEGHGKILKQNVLIWNPNYLAVSPANSGFIEDCAAATIQWHLDLLLFCFLLHLDSF